MIPLQWRLGDVCVYQADRSVIVGFYCDRLAWVKSEHDGVISIANLEDLDLVPLSEREEA